MIILLMTFIYLTSASALAVDECRYTDGLPNQDEFSAYTNINNELTKKTQNNSCQLIDNDPLFQDKDVKKVWCKAGCQDEIKDDQRQIVMPEMASPNAKRWHSNWHTISQLYRGRTINKLKQKIADKKAGGDSGKAKTAPGPLREADLWPVKGNAPTDAELLSSVDSSQEQIQSYMLYDDIPSQCKKTIPANKRKPIKSYDPLIEEDFDPEYKDCVKKNWSEDLRNFLVKNQSVGGENFLFMHHQMRNQVQLMLSKQGLPCISAWSETPGPDGKSGDQQWEVNHDFAAYTFPESMQDELEKSKLTKPKFIEREANKRLAEFLKDRKAGKNPSLEDYVENYGINLVQKMFESPEFLKEISLNELGTMMEGSIHGYMHMTYSGEKGCSYKDKSGNTVNLSSPPASCDLGDTGGSHINATFWKLHGWCDDVMKKWMHAGDRKYESIGTTESCKEKACYKVKGTFIGGMPQF